MLKVIIVEDNSIFRKSIGSLLEKEEIAEIIGYASNGKEFLDIIENLNPDLVLMDLSMPIMDGIEATRAVLEKRPELKILTLSSFSDTSYLLNVVNAGVKGFVLKDANVMEFILAIKTVAEGGIWYSQDLLKNVLITTNNNRIETKTLTKRELQILQLICNGLTNEHIANSLNLSYDTIRWHRSNILSKTSCSNTAALVMYAIKNKIVKL